jgi:hypothetical protein
LQPGDRQPLVKGKRIRQYSDPAADGKESNEDLNTSECNPNIFYASSVFSFALPG